MLYRCGVRSAARRRPRRKEHCYLEEDEDGHEPVDVVHGGRRRGAMQRTHPRAARRQKRRGKAREEVGQRCFARRKVVGPLVPKRRVQMELHLAQDGPGSVNLKEHFF